MARSFRSTSKPVSKFERPPNKQWQTPHIQRNSVEFVGVSEEVAAGSGSIVLIPPGSLQDGDILIAAIHSTDNVAHAMDDVAQTEEGLPRLFSQVMQANGGGATSRMSVWWLRYDSANAGQINYNVTHASGNSIIGFIAAFRYCFGTGYNSAVSPIDVVSVTGTGADASIEIPAVIPTVANTMLLYITGAGDDNARTAQPTGWTNILVNEEPIGIGYTTALGSDSSISAAYKRHATGMINFPSESPVETQAAADPWISVMIAIKPMLSTTGTSLVNQVGAESTASGTLAISGTSTNAVAAESVAAGTLTIIGTGTGEVGAESVAGGTIVITGTGTNEVGAESVAAGSLAITGTSTNEVGAASDATGTLAISGTSTNEVGAESVAIGNVESPVVETPAGGGFNVHKQLEYYERLEAQRQEEEDILIISTAFMEGIWRRSKVA